MAKCGRKWRFNREVARLIMSGERQTTGSGKAFDGNGKSDDTVGAGTRRFARNANIIKLISEWGKAAGKKKRL